MKTGVIGVASAALFWVMSVTPVFASSVLSVSPAIVASGSSDTTVTVTGTGFVSGANVRANGVLLSTTYIDSASLSGVVRASMLAVDQSLRVDVLGADGILASGSVVLTVGAGGDVQQGLSMDQWHTIVFSLLGGLGAYVFIAGIGRLW